MKLTLADPAYLKDSIAVISDLVNEARFKITPDAVELIAMDPANVAMVIFKLFSSCFVEYEPGKNTDLAINLNNLKQILRRAKSNDILTLELTEDNKLEITLKSKNTRKFSLPIIELDDKEQKIPELKFPVTVKTNCSILNESIEDVDIVAESVSFVANKDKLTIRAEGNLSKANIDIPAGEHTVIATDNDHTKAKYSIEYLKKMINGSKLADHVEIHFNQDYPLKLEYKVVDKVMLAFILAPRVEND